MKNTWGEGEGGRQPPLRGRGFPASECEARGRKFGLRSTVRQPTNKDHRQRAIGARREGANRGQLHRGETPRSGARNSKRKPKKKRVERSEALTALRVSGGSVRSPNRERATQAERETSRSALVGAEGSDQPPKGAKCGRRTQWGERSTATGGAYEHTKERDAI